MAAAPAPAHTPPPGAPAPVGQRARLALRAAGALAVFVAARGVLPRLPLPAGGVGFVLATACLLMLGVVVFPIVAWSMQVALRATSGAAVLGALAAVAVAGSATARTDLVGDLATLLAALLAAALCMRRVATLAVVLGALWVGAAADAWSFYSSSGVTHGLVRADGFVGRMWAVRLPNAGHAYPVTPQIGFIDLVAIGLLLAMCARFRVSRLRLVAWFVVLEMVLAAAQRFGGLHAVPEVPLLAVAATGALLPHVIAGRRLLAQRVRAERVLHGG